MNHMIEKYIYAVTKRCPSNNREEIKKELESYIFDMLGDNTKPTDQEIDDVLHKIGNPIHVASKYQTEERHVVPPMFYQDYILILKYVLIGFIIISVIVSMIESLVNLDSQFPVNFVGNIITNTFTNLFSFMFAAFGFTTLAFWSYSIPKVKQNVDEWLTNWKTKDLMDVPKEEIKFKPSGRLSILIEMIFAVLFSVAFGVLFIVYYENIAIYVVDQTSYPILNLDYKPLFTAFIIISNILLFLRYAYHLNVGYVNSKLLIFRAVVKLLSIIGTIIILLLPNLLTPMYYDGLIALFETDLTTVTYWTNIIIYTMIAFMIGIYIIEWLTTTIKYVSKKNTQNKKC